ncbi:transglutaminase family protein [Galactobacter caseinivorans]|uniref:Transglutaminase domain-containing protein n=1 Tax=Galactobacter caseinivorans TaxID=2676123 RepID=A0A496PKP5_9MICC|nr:transglutaminase domain-containing protein [Galactobacter caseinivorans]RKW70977.1 transglutaminase domain-containing protein [Galactobacter caseinivorans]
MSAAPQQGSAQPGTPGPDGAPRQSATRREHRLRAQRQTTPVRDLLFYAVMIGVCAVPLWPLYQHPAVGITVLGALLGGLGIGWLGRVRALPWPVFTVVALAWGLLIGVPLAVPTHALNGFIPTLDGLAVFVTGLVRSWVDILSVDPPLGNYDAVLVPVFVLVYAGAVCAVRGFLSGRRWPGVLAAVALLLFGIIFGMRTGYRPVEVGVASLFVALAWIVAVRPAVRGMDESHSRRLRAGQVRRGMAALVFALVCALAGGALAAALSPDRREVLRSAFSPTFELQRHVSPLQEYRSWVTDPSAETTVATVQGLPAGSMLRVAVMDQYNGVAMQVGNGGSSGTFARVPSKIQREGGARERIQVDLKVSQGQWLPLAGALDSLQIPEELRDRFYFNKSLDAAVLSGDAPQSLSYSMESVPLPAPMRDGLGSLTPGSAKQADLEQVPQKLVDAVETQWVKASEPGDRLQLALSYLQAGFVSHGGDEEVFSRSGHSVERLDLLTQEDPMVGDAEQYSVAFAVLARELGFPSRVVSGYVDSNGDGQLQGSELTAWVEVQDQQRGWVGIDPNPEPRETKKQEKSKQNSIALPRSVLPPEVPRQEDTVTPNMDETAQTPTPPPSELSLLIAAIWWWTWRVGLSLLLLTSPLWILVLLEAWRRGARRRRDRRRLSVAGGWAELRDEVIDAGHPVAWSDTRTEVAQGSGRDTVMVMARRADELSFAPWGAQRDDVERYWKGVRAARKDLRTGRTRRQRWAQRFSWRSVTRWLRETFRP